METFEDALLISTAPNRGELPRVRTVGHHPSDVAPIRAAIRDQLGLDTIVLACTKVDVANGVVRRVLDLEVLDDSARAAAPPAQPSGRSRLDRPWLVDTRHGLDRRAGARHRLGPVRAIEQIRTWEFSCVLRVQTDQAELYFKALPCSYAHEPRLAQHLTERHPDFVPEVVAMNERERWLLMRACRGRCLESGAPLSAWERAAAAYAELQVAAAAHAPRLAVLGCRQRGPLELRADLGPLFADDPSLLGPAVRTHHGALRGLRQLRPSLEAACDELAASGLPLTLEHGDLWSSNVYVGDDQVGFIDWTDASLSHPFFSLMPFVQSVQWDPRVNTVPGARERIIDRYLEPWTSYAPQARLRRALALARPLAALHIAITYWRDIPQPHLQWWMPRMVPFFARLALEQWDNVSSPG